MSTMRSSLSLKYRAGRIPAFCTWTEISRQVAWDLVWGPSAGHPHGKLPVTVPTNLP